jgi:hypothetical protein
MSKQVKEIAKKLCEKSGCHHKCHDTKDCVVEDEAELLLINENKSNNFDVKSNNELFKQALVEGVSRHFDKIIEQEKQIEEMAEIIHKADVNNDTNTIYFPLSMAECLNKHGAKRTNESIALYNAGYRKQSEGEWNDNIIGFCNVCMNCGAIVERSAIKNNSGKLNFCPNCGAKMKGGEE